MLANVVAVKAPLGWLYAQSEASGIRIAAPSSGATMAFVPVASTQPDVVWPKLYGLLGELDVTGVAPDAIDLKKPQATWPADELDVRVWQVEKPPRSRDRGQNKDPLMGDEPGALLVGLTEVDASHAVLCVGFLKRSAPSNLVEPINHVIRSMSIAPQASDGATETAGAP